MSSRAIAASVPGADPGAFPTPDQNFEIVSNPPAFASSNTPTIPGDLMHIAKWLVAASLVLALIPAGLAQAGSKEGVTMPDTVSVAGKTLVLNGMGLREATFLKVDVYVAGLYLEAKSKDAPTILNGGKAKRIHLVFKRDIKRDEMIEALNGAFNKNAGDKKAALKEHMRTFSSWLAPLPERSTMTLTHVPGAGLTLAINGKDKGTIPSDDFAQVIFAGWLGGKVEDGALKRQLLGR
jgi:hypothetical protein